MTRAEFETWIAIHYPRVLKRAARRDGGEDALAELVARLVADPALLAEVELREGLDGWLLARVDGALKNANKAARRSDAVMERLAADWATTGGDIFKDLSRDKRAARNQRHRPAPAGEMGPLLASGSDIRGIWHRGTPTWRRLAPGEYRGHQGGWRDG